MLKSRSRGEMTRDCLKSRNFHASAADHMLGLAPFGSGPDDKHMKFSEHYQLLATGIYLPLLACPDNSGAGVVNPKLRLELPLCKHGDGRTTASTKYLSVKGSCGLKFQFHS